LNSAFFTFTKITQPQPRQLLDQPNLLLRLGLCRNFPLTLITAGPSFDETRLLTTFAHNSEMALAWYTLDKNDRDLAVFCRYLLQALRMVHPSFGQTFEQLLEQSLKGARQVSLMTRLATEFNSNLELLKNTPSETFRETLIVLNDFQLAESLEVNLFVQKLIWGLPAAFHLVITTRRVPRDLQLTQLAARQMLLVLGPGDMA
jgi:ATP/maltotriose-dependent transcriptional regulator MalT